MMAVTEGEINLDPATIMAMGAGDVRTDDEAAPVEAVISGSGQLAARVMRVIPESLPTPRPLHGNGNSSDRSFGPYTAQF